MSDAIRIAKTLSPSQRYHVERGSISGDFSMATVNALHRKGLFELRVDSPNGQWGFMEPTPLCREVQAVLRNPIPGEKA